MLVPSHRHTAADLRYWEELEYADLAHGQSTTVRKRAAKAVEHIKRYAAKPFYVGVSWGKDSVVVADIVLRASRICGFAIPPLVWIRVEPIANPDCETVRDAFFRIHDAPYHEVVVECDSDEWGVHATGTLERGIKQGIKLAGAVRRITGVRADESADRTLSAKVHGVATESSCRPLLAWSANNVFGWLAAKNLPVHPVYAMCGGGRWPREYIRVASLGGKRGNKMGRSEWEREYYGDVLSRIGAL